MFTLVVNGCAIEDSESIGSLVEKGESIRNAKPGTMWQVYQGMTEVRHCLDWDRFTEEFNRWFDGVFSAS